MSTDFARNLKTVLESHAFQGAGGTGPVVGSLSHIGVFNPEGSGVRLVVTKIMVSVTKASDVSFRQHDAMLNTLSNSHSKNGFELISKGICSREDAPGLIGSRRFVVTLDAGQFFTYELMEWPFVLYEGQGLIAACETSDARITAIYEWLEI